MINSKPVRLFYLWDTWNKAKPVAYTTDDLKK